ncbi:MAG: PEP-CTERM sorting domain-containing protein [Anaerohalosphaeraceae bacterium]
MEVKRATVILSLLVFAVQMPLFAAVQVLDPAYQAEVYTTYSGVSWGASRIAADSSGNLYITHTNAQVNKITSDKTVINNWSTGFNTPWSIVDATGTSYGDKLYVTENSGSISTINFNTGARSSFTSLSAASGLAIDKTGNYGGSMYAGTTVSDTIERISTSGQKTTFCSYFAGMGGGGIASVAFDSSNQYGGSMFAATWSASDSRSGIYAINQQGQATRFCSNLVWGSDIEFDALGVFFDGDMFATGKEKSTDSLQLYRIGSDGIATPFIRADGEINGFTFGADGALYFHEYYQGASNIIRVVPEPATMLLLGLGCLGLYRRK